VNETGKTTRNIAWFSQEGEWLFALSVTTIFLLYAGFINLHHEMWRDEMEAWLVSRDTPSPLAIFRSIRYEGHPAVWYLLLWPLTHLTRNPEAMQILNLFIMACAVFLISKVAPAPRWLRAAAVFGYFPLYEYGSIARNYAVGFLSIIAICAVFPYRRERPILIGVLLLISANTSLPACMLAIAMLLALVVEATILLPEQPRRIATWVGFGIAAGGIAISVIQMNPPPDNGYPGWFFGFDIYRIGRVLQTVTKSYFPLPKPGTNFWQSEIFALLPVSVKYLWVGIGGPILLALTTLALIRRPVALMYFIVGSLGLLAFFYFKFLGYLRHHGFLFVCFGSALWLAATMPPVIRPGPLNAVARWAERAIAILLPMLFVVQLSGAAIAAICEYKYVFSAAKSTAELIRERGLGHLPLVGDLDCMAMPVIGYLGKDYAYYPAGGRFGSYVVWDKARDEHHYNVWDQSVRLAKRIKLPVVVLVDKLTLENKPPPLELRPKLQMVGCPTSENSTDESYCVFLLDERPY
jgi:hypothetical protein